jgi:hypothetical protein
MKMREMIVLFLLLGILFTLFGCKDQRSIVSFRGGASLDIYVQGCQAVDCSQCGPYALR